jgi:hypothetical protein
MLSVDYDECQIKALYAECHHAGCHHAECRGVAQAGRLTRFCSNFFQSFPGGRRDMIFPPGCVEATPPYMLKRRKYTKGDVQPVDGWRLVMALRSGLLMESTWALDVLNILLYDDIGVTFFGLGNMPGLLVSTP